MRDLVAFCKRLPYSWGVVLLAIVPATLLTMFEGRISSHQFFLWWSTYFAEWPFGVLDWLVNVTIVAVLLWALSKVVASGWRWWSKPVADGSSEGQLYRLLDDVPIDHETADDFDRGTFVTTIAKIVVLPPNANSFVLALESAWGSGKSSVLALLAKHLGAHADKPLVVRFNPWLATGQERVSRAFFFSQFSAALLSAGERSLAIGLVRFGEVLEDLLPARARSISTIGLQHFRRLVGRIPVIDLDGEQEGLRRAVAAVGRPIVVIIDDIDRLPADDIRVVFQLVKAVAAFPRVAYLLAFDPAPIDVALAFDGSPESGRQFRDKIVQANLSLPRVRYSRRKQYFTTKLFERVKYWQFSLDHSEKRLIDKAIPIVLAALRTPRDMKRVLNKTLLVADNLRGEVNFADVLVFETIHAKYPVIAETIRRNPRVVDPMRRGDEEMSESVIARMVWSEMDEKKGKTESLKEFVALYPHEQEVLSPLLTFAFPSMFDESPAEEDADLAGDQRIAIHENLLKLLYQGLHGEFLSAQDARSFLTDPGSRTALLADAQEAGSLSAWFAHVRSHVASVEVVTPALLIQQIAQAVNALYGQSKIDATDDSRWLILDLLRAMPEHERSAALEQLVSDKRTASVAEQVLTSLLRDAGMWASGTYLGADSPKTAHGDPLTINRQELDRLRQVWLGTVAELGVRSIVLEYPNAGSVLFRWGQLSDPPYAVVASEVDEALEDADVAVGILNYFEMGKGLDGVEKFVLDSAWQKLRKHLQDSRVPNVTKERFEEHFVDLDAKRWGGSKEQSDAHAGANRSEDTDANTER